MRSSTMHRLLMCGVLLAAFHTIHSNTPAYCLLQLEGGTGAQHLLMAYYDSNDGNCYPFFYKGEGGNQNRFTNEKECIRNCSSQAEALYPVDEREACLLPYKKGSVCRQSNVRFRYDPIHDKCKPFQWTGCMGNGNRFLTEQQCNDTCNGVHVDGDEPEEDEFDTPIGLICGLILGGIVAILIIAAVVLIIKSKDDPKKAPKKPKREEAPLQQSAIEMN